MIGVVDLNENEVRLVHEKDAWHIYQDGMQVMGGFFVSKDKVIAKFEARQLANKLSPCELIVIDYSGMEESKEYF